MIKKFPLESYVCRECDLTYNDEKWANKCEKWCRKNNSCNLEITKHSREVGKLLGEE